MKRYLFMGLVVLIAALNAAENPFDLKKNLQSLDKSEDFILSELGKVYETKNKKTDTITRPEAEAKDTDMKTIHKIVSESPAIQTEPKVTEEQTTTLPEPKNDELNGVEENKVADVISDVVAGVMEEESDVKASTNEITLEVKPQNKEIPESSHGKMLKITVQDIPIKEESKEAVAPAKMQPVLETKEIKTQENKVSHNLTNKLTQDEITEIYSAALKEAKGK